MGGREIELQEEQVFEHEEEDEYVLGFLEGLRHEGGEVSVSFES
jgi:hypothetical protein